MERKYNFSIVFEKLEQARRDFQADLQFDYALYDEIDESIKVLKEYLSETENTITFTRT